MSRKTISLMEQVFRALITDRGFIEVTIALHNACAHGEVFDHITGEGLEEIFEHLDGLVASARKIFE